MQSSSFLQQPENIPEQVVLKILPCLPVQSLLRFSCVCKAWKSLISDPKFTLSPRKQRIAIQSGYVYSIDTGHAFSGTVYQSKRHPLFKPVLFNDDKYASKRLMIFGSCNGLFLVGHHKDFYLWNVSTRQSTKVLSLRVRTRPELFNVVDLNPHLSGLCYDSSTGDYKAVFPRDFKKVAVLNFRRKKWAATAFPALDEDNYGNSELSRSGPIVNGKLHWAVIAYRRGRNWRKERYVVCFDPLTDEFGELPMPLSLPNNGSPSEPIINGLGVLDGCLCMARSADVHGSGDVEVETGFLELLVMKEYGVGGSWTKVLKVSKDFTFMSCWNFVPLCFTEDGEVVISNPEFNRLFSHNLEDMSERDLLVTSKGPITYQTCYTESFVSPHCHDHGERWILEYLRDRDMFYRNPEEELDFSIRLE